MVMTLFSSLPELILFDVTYNVIVFLLAYTPIPYMVKRNN